jgi:hypothetical protein
MAELEVANGTPSKVNLGVDGTVGGPRPLSAPAQHTMHLDMKGISELARKVGLEEDRGYQRSSPCLAPCPIVVAPNHQAAMFCCGKYLGTIKESGIHFISCCEMPTMVNMARKAIEMKEFKVLDSNGNPIVISGNVAYSFQSAVKPTIDVEKPDHYLRMQAQSSLKRVAARYPYEAPEGQPCLKSEAKEFTTELQDALQRGVLPAGAVVLAFELTDLSYAPEIAAAMLQKQQAKAMVEAREIIVHAAVHITDQALKELRSLGHTIDKDAEQKITSNLLTVICSGQQATPTLPLSS